jgi:transposase
VRLIPAHYVKPFLKGHKNDYRDAEAIAEAVQRPTMNFVAIKTPEQMDLLALHRVRSRLVGQRTGVINQIRGFLIERGITVRQGLVPLRKALPEILSSNTDVLSPRMVGSEARTQLSASRCPGSRVGAALPLSRTPSPFRTRCAPSQRQPQLHRL